MLEMDINVVKGIIFVHLNGVLNRDTFNQFGRQLDYLLYKQGMHYFVIDFNDLNVIDYGIINYLENKLVEIFLSCGKVALCGLDMMMEKHIGRQDKLFFIKNEYDALKYLNI